MTKEELITACQKGNRKAQRQLYERYAPTLLGVCRRYIRNPEDAEDVLIEGMFKILTKIDQYNGLGSFDGWMRRIIVNESLMHLRKAHNFNMVAELPQNELVSQYIPIEAKLAADEILILLDDLPTGYRTVFNLYVLEGYKHREIADLLSISINTSKSQLILARKKLREMLAKKGILGIG